MKNVKIKSKKNKKISNFIYNIINYDILKNKSNKNIITRFPPEPNGYLHIGHAKSIYLNINIANKYNGVCLLRFDDTNPKNENFKYVSSIIDSLQWLGFSFNKINKKLHFASNYYKKFYKYAKLLINKNKAYVDSQTSKEIKINRGTTKQVGIKSPFRNRSINENIYLFKNMKYGKFKEGEHVLRAKIDMNSKNFNMRDPILYRICFTPHYKLGNKWCIHPTYDYAHCISDALEGITHSICTTEFEDHKPLYNWILSELAKEKIFKFPLPKQIEFSRLNITYTITSKRTLSKLINKKYINNWEDPRLPTIIGMRRRGYTASSIKSFCNKLGITKNKTQISLKNLENELRIDLNKKARRAICVLNPIKLIITNFDKNKKEKCYAQINSNYPSKGVRVLYFSKELLIERTDFSDTNIKNYFRLFIGNKVRLKYAYIIKCTGYKKDKFGNIKIIYCKYFPNSKFNKNQNKNNKIKCSIHWLNVKNAIPAKIYLYSNLFNHKYPNKNNKKFLNFFNSESKQKIYSYVEQSLINTIPETHFQFERNGYFVSDIYKNNKKKLVFNKTVDLKKTWKKH